jgi:hypothetical protein
MIADQIRNFIKVEGWCLFSLKVIARGIRDGTLKPRP